MLSNNKFFNQLSGDYDAMVNFENSLKNKQEYLQRFIELNYTNGLDLGCGTGADAIAMSKLGLVVDAVDQSKGMLDQAKKNSTKFDTAINFIHSNLTDFTSFNKTYDIIVSLGNPIANLEGNDVRTLLKKLYNNLNERGKIVIQIINYSKLPTKGTYVLNTFENDSISIVRKYDIHPDSIDFIIDKTDTKTHSESKIVTKLYPHSENDFSKMTKEIGCKMALYGNLKKDAFVAKESPNLVVVLTK